MFSRQEEKRNSLIRAMVELSSNQNTTKQDEPMFPFRTWELIWYSVIFVVGALGNSLVCLTFFKSSLAFRSTPFNKYLCSLAVADMLLAVVVLPVYILCTPVFDHPRGIWGDVLCKTITGYFPSFYFSNVSEYSLILISLNRLNILQKYPMSISNNSIDKQRPSRLAIAAAWIIPFAVQCPAFYLLEYKGKRKPVLGNYCTFHWGREATLSSKIYGGVYLIILGLIPLTIYIYSFYVIGKCLLKEEKMLSVKLRRNSFSDGYRYFHYWQVIERRRVTVKILMSATAVFLVCWIPNKIMFFMVNCMGEKNTTFTVNSVIYQIGVLIGFTGSCVNPFLYALQSSVFRGHAEKALKSLLPNCLNGIFEYRKIGNVSQKNQKTASSAKISKQVDRKRHVHSPTTSLRSTTPSKSYGTTEQCKKDTPPPKINVIAHNRYLAYSV